MYKWSYTLNYFALNFFACHILETGIHNLAYCVLYQVASVAQ